jgi:hypothetical protein
VGIAATIQRVLTSRSPGKVVFVPGWTVFCGRHPLSLQKNSRVYAFCSTSRHGSSRGFRFRQDLVPILKPLSVSRQKHPQPIASPPA